MSEMLVFIYTGLENVLTTMQISYSGQQCRWSLSFQWWHVSMFSYIGASTPSHNYPEPSAKVNDCIISLFKSSKWVIFCIPICFFLSPGSLSSSKHTSTCPTLASLLCDTLCSFSEPAPRLTLYRNQSIFHFWCNLIETDMVHFPSHLWW